ncbi:ABC transporter permease [Halalkalibacillus sediminis]|uniref:ABC transporter permease n=1 Tax=Halalkalibacillus sediminis TaxID=2018042 RepID=A0A2I0QRI0_9BACI|nr:ABC transporter permease subunit [Halalkalibacillus sediminis]PKR76947.1 ABC transporter permease [Halalkalibacillus sediminis]
MQWMVIFKKELLENWRNFKWVWVPIVFIIFAIMDPITTYYLPRIMESVGGMPDGAVIDIPMPSPPEALMMSYGEIGLIGVLIIVVISMGLISSEIKSGVYELILSKPVHYSNYITAKFASMFLLVSISIVLGVVAAWYYVNVLFGDLGLVETLVSVLFYLAYILLLLAIVMFFNTIFKSQGLVAFVSIFVIIVLNVVTNIYKHMATWSPMLISDYIGAYLFSGQMETEIWWSTLIAIGLAVVLLIAAIGTLKNKAME